MNGVRSVREYIQGALIGVVAYTFLPTWLVVVSSIAGLLWLIKTMEAR